MFASLILAATLAAQPLTVHDIIDVASLSSPLFSPDGRQIAYVVTVPNADGTKFQSDLWRVDADGTNDVQLTHGESGADHPRWSPDGKRLAFLSGGAIRIFAANGGESEKLTDEKGSISEFAWSPDGRSMAFVMREASNGEKKDWHVVGAQPRYARLYVIDIDSRTVKRLTDGDASFLHPSWSPDGSTIAVERELGGFPDFQKTDIVLVARDGGMRTLVSRPGADQSPLFSPDGRSIAFLSTGGVADWLREQQIWVVPTSGGTARLVSAAYDRTPSRMEWDADSRGLWFDGPWDTTSQIFHVGSDGGGFRDVSRVDGVIGAADLHGGTAAFVLQSLTEPPELYLSPLDGFSPRRLTHHNDAFRGRPLATTRLIQWKNPKDGMQIEGLLTLPIGYTPGKRVPLLTFVHGGPASHFDRGFVGYLGSLYPVQVFAEDGFAVLRPNPRGTGGYGEKFREANRSDWGGMDWVDINAGIDKVIADGIADPSRLGMMGWSYGGFMTAWAAGHSSRLEAISIGAPVVDLLSFHGTTDIRAFIPSYFPGRDEKPADAGPAQGADSTLEAIRNAPMSLDLLRAHSPLWHLQPTRARIMIQQDDGDERVPLSQGTMLYRMLQEVGADVTMVVYHGAGHIPPEPKERVDVMQRNVDLFRSAVRDRSR